MIRIKFVYTDKHQYFTHVMYLTNAVSISLFQDLPEGAAFSAVIQETKDKLPACKLRLSQKSAADQIWEDYGNGKLRAILKEKLLHGIGADNNHLKMSIHIMEEEYEWACKTLAGRIFFPFLWSFQCDF